MAIGQRVAGQEEPAWIGSGFFYARTIRAISETEARYATYLVTNRHVLEGKEAVVIRANPRSDDEAPRDYDLDLGPSAGEGNWTVHPDPEIDVAVVGTNYQLMVDEGMQVAVFQSNSAVLRVPDMREAGVSEGDFVFLLGFPMGLVGQHRSTVIVRGGTIARIRDTMLGTEKTFLVDASVFPGNSGGPVILKPEVISITGTTAINSAYLIGILRAYVPYRDVAVSLQTQQPRVIFEENSGLVEVHGVDRIEETIDVDRHWISHLQSEAVEGTASDEDLSRAQAESELEGGATGGATQPTETGRDDPAVEEADSQ